MSRTKKNVLATTVTTRISRPRKITLYGTKKIDVPNCSFERPSTMECLNFVMGANEIEEILGGGVDVIELLRKKKIDYPKYLYNHINVACTQRGATSWRKVGKLHAMHRDKKGGFRTLGEWRNYYLKRYPGAIKEATSLIMEDFDMLEVSKMIRAMVQHYVEEFVENLLIDQTFRGLKIQEIILRKTTEVFDKSGYTWSTDKEDGRGIDGYVGNIPVSIKPDSCNLKKASGVKLITYKINEKKSELSFTVSM